MGGCPQDRGAGEVGMGSGTILNREHIGKTSDQLVEIWNTFNPGARSLMLLDKREYANDPPVRATDFFVQYCQAASLTYARSASTLFTTNPHHLYLIFCPFPAIILIALWRDRISQDRFSRQASVVVRGRFVFLSTSRSRGIG
jgi:hypothetical protein